MSGLFKSKKSSSGGGGSSGSQAPYSKIEGPEILEEWDIIKHVLFGNSIPTVERGEDEQLGSSGYRFRFYEAVEEAVGNRPTPRNHTQNSESLLDLKDSFDFSGPQFGVSATFYFSNKEHVSMMKNLVSLARKGNVFSKELGQGYHFHLEGLEERGTAKIDGTRYKKFRGYAKFMDEHVSDADVRHRYQSPGFKTPPPPSSSTHTSSSKKGGLLKGLRKKK